MLNSKMKIRALSYIKTKLFWVLVYASCFLLITTTTAQAFNIYRVGEIIKGSSYNDVWKKWFEKDFSIWVGVSEEGTEYILFKADTGLGDATVTTQYSDEVKNKLESLLLKAIEWSDVAKKNKADTTKGLGCFGSDEYQICEQDGNAFEQNQMGLKFFAANGGQQINLIIDIIDRDNQFYKEELYLKPLQMKKLLVNVRKIEDVFKKARETSKKQELFK